MEESQRKKADQSALRLWRINETLFAAYPHYLAASGAPVEGALPGISMHTELELLVRLGFSPREALAAATNNYSLQFGWNELGLIAPGRRADILVVDGDPTAEHLERPPHLRPHPGRQSGRSRGGCCDRRQVSRTTADGQFQPSKWRNAARIV